MEQYKELLQKAYSKLPKKISVKERFEIPKVVGHIQGNKTIISNFSQICDIFQREKSHLLKYLQRELATPASIDGPRLVLGRKLSSDLINAKIVQYANDFVTCTECKKPDTKLVKEGKFLFVKCAACGAKHPVKSRI